MLLDKEYLGLDKLVYRKLDSCELYVGERGGEVILVFLYRSRNASFFKVILGHESNWDCYEVLLQPKGLYGFFRDERELIEKLL